MGTCNYCSFQELKRRAKRHKQTVTTKEERGGVSVYIDGRFACWYMKLPDSCHC